MVWKKEQENLLIEHRREGDPGKPGSRKKVRGGKGKKEGRRQDHCLNAQYPALGTYDVARGERCQKKGIARDQNPRGGTCPCQKKERESGSSIWYSASVENQTPFSSNGDRGGWSNSGNAITKWSAPWIERKGGKRGEGDIVTPFDE